MVIITQNEKSSFLRNVNAMLIKIILWVNFVAQVNRDKILKCIKVQVSSKF
jgi:hypothetical protein